MARPCAGTRVLYLGALPCHPNGKHVCSKNTRRWCSEAPSGSRLTLGQTGWCSPLLGLVELASRPVGGPETWVADPHTLASQSSSPLPAQEDPGGLLSSILLRFLLTAVALLSSYSIHLLLKSSGIVGEPLTQPGARREGLEGEPLTVLTLRAHRHPCL